MNKYITYKIKRFFSWPIRATKASVLSIRFPFLYPRNRWTGKHYTHWKLWNYHRDKWIDAYKWANSQWEVKNKYLAFKIKCADFLDNFLSIFHCIPSYTELDAMPEGWRKCFGIQICKEIKKALLEDGGRKKLRKYRIEDIKEKNGSLQWYDNGGCEETSKIIKKYEYISYRTCIECGKAADYVTNGWIIPYCSKCIPKNEKENSSKYFSDVDFYGWTNGEYYEKHKNDKNYEGKE